MEELVSKHKCFLNSCNLNQVNLDDCAEEYNSQKAEYMRIEECLQNNLK